jgi:phosphatidate cytidylyltransferase
MSTFSASDASPVGHTSGHSQAKLVPAIGIAGVALLVILLPSAYSVAIMLLVAMVMVGELLIIAASHGHHVTAHGKNEQFTCSSLITLCLLLGFPLWIELLQRKAGAELLAIVIFCTYFSDVAALYGGQFLSRRGGIIASKLAPRVSPNKTIVGVICGLVASLLLAAIIGMIFGAHHGMTLLLISVAIFTLLGVSGDLSESYLKRLAGIKDSSHLLAGHGGFLDRNDALMVSSMVACGLFAIHWF